VAMICFFAFWWTRQLVQNCTTFSRLPPLPTQVPLIAGTSTHSRVRHGLTKVPQTCCPWMNRTSLPKRILGYSSGHRMGQWANKTLMDVCMYVCMYDLGQRMRWGCQQIDRYLCNIDGLNRGWKSSCCFGGDFFGK
jgi:hypothetical protein